MKEKSDLSNPWVGKGLMSVTAPVGEISHGAVGQIMEEHQWGFKSGTILELERE